MCTAAMGFALMFPLYALGGFGGGDLKLVVAIGAATRAFGAVVRFVLGGRFRRAAGDRGPGPRTPQPGVCAGDRLRFVAVLDSSGVCGPCDGVVSCPVSE